MAESKEVTQLLISWSEDEEALDVLTSWVNNDLRRIVSFSFGVEVPAARSFRPVRSRAGQVAFGASLALRGAPSRRVPGFEAVGKDQRQRPLDQKRAFASD